MSEDKAPTAEQLKELGNDSVKTKKYTEAILHYTHAIKLEPNNHILYSNRSFAFLKMDQFSLALQDAAKTIKLDRTWWKGYFREGEIFFAAGQYLTALASYEMAYKYNQDEHIVLSMKKCRIANLKEMKADEQIPWVGSGIGIVVGVIILIADYIFTEIPTHPMIMAVVTVAIALAGYAFAKCYRFYVKSQRETLGKDLYDNDEKEDEESPETEVKTSPRYTKSQARQRYWKGKM